MPIQRRRVTLHAFFVYCLSPQLPYPYMYRPFANIILNKGEYMTELKICNNNKLEFSFRAKTVPGDHFKFTISAKFHVL